MMESEDKGVAGKGMTKKEKERDGQVKVEPTPL